jgi:Uma2 family endonuclease
MKRRKARDELDWHAFRVVINEEVRIPKEVVDLDSFCRWAMSDQYPEYARISYLNGPIWVEVGLDKPVTYNPVKNEVIQTLYGLVKARRTARFFSEGVWLRNKAADLAVEPDGMYVSYAALKEKRVTPITGRDRLVLEGSPDLVLEVVSDTSVNKNIAQRRDLYWKAGVREYWLIDLRDGKLQFLLLKHGDMGYTATRKKAGGWLRSDVFGMSFRLTRQADPLGDSLYLFDVHD